MHTRCGIRDHVLELPAADDYATPGVRWGRFDEICTPAFWRGQVWQHEMLGTYRPGPLGRGLPEEVAACMLGGYGIPAELGLAAFARLRDGGHLVGSPCELVIEAELSRPFNLGGASRRYRFHKVKSRALAGALRGLDAVDGRLPDRDLRDALIELPGVGPKTASWVVRNFRSSDEVAIIDVHIARAGRLAGFLAPEWNPSAHYMIMEAAFLRFAAALRVRPSVLDGLMWDYMRCLGPVGRNAAGQASVRTPMAAVPQATIRGSIGNNPRAKPSPNGPSGQKASPDATAQRCKVARRAPASRQSRLPGLA